MSILSNGDLVGAYNYMILSYYILIKHNKESGAITCFQNLGATLYTTSSFESSVLVGGYSSTFLHRWAIIDSSNTPTTRCSAVPPT